MNFVLLVASNQLYSKNCLTFTSFFFQKRLLLYHTGCVVGCTATSTVLKVSKNPAFVRKGRRREREEKKRKTKERTFTAMQCNLGSISPTFDARIFHTKANFAAFI